MQTVHCARQLWCARFDHFPGLRRRPTREAHQCRQRHNQSINILAKPINQSINQFFLFSGTLSTMFFCKSTLQTIVQELIRKQQKIFDEYETKKMNLCVWKINVFYCIKLWNFFFIWNPKKKVFQKNNNKIVRLWECAAHHAHICSWTCCIHRTAACDATLCWTHVFSCMFATACCSCTCSWILYKICLKRVEPNDIKIWM